MATQAQRNTIKKLELRLKPLAPSIRPGPIQIWRQTGDDPPLFRPEHGGDWIDEQTMLAQCLSTGSKVPSLVLVIGDWGSAADERAHAELMRGIQPGLPVVREVTLTQKLVSQSRLTNDHSESISGV